MLVVRCAAVEFSSIVLSILLSGGAGGMTDVGGLTDAVDSSLTASLFSFNSSYSSYALYFPTFAPLKHTSYVFFFSSPADLCLFFR